LRAEPPEHQNSKIALTSTRHNSTTMDPIQKAIEDIKAREDGASFSYCEVAKRWSCNQTTLAWSIN
jgi:hypothetical protein